MKYTIEFQYADGKNKRPSDEGYMKIAGQVGDGNQIIIPNVGDYVRIEHNDYMHSGEFIEGKVRSRYFQYAKLAPNLEEWCIVNIVIEATEDDFGMILKM